MAALGESPHRLHVVRLEEDVGALRRSIGELASHCAGISASEAALVATELATNIVRHTSSGGYVLYRSTADGLEMIAVDHGPGFRRTGSLPTILSDRSASHASHRSSGLGVGLASVEHLASTFDLYSSGSGTVVLTRFSTRAPRGGSCRWGGVNVALHEGEDSGDRWAVSSNGILAALVVDGLGHGPEAAKASQAAVSVFASAKRGDPGTFVAAAHEAMRETRGGMLGLCLIDPSGDELRYAGIGNISARMLQGAKSRNFLSKEGSLGTHLSVPRSRVEHHRWAPGAILVMMSDGLKSHWDLAPYPGLVGHDPALVAATLLRDFRRGSDDATVLVVEDLRKAKE